MNHKQQPELPPISHFLKHNDKYWHSLIRYLHPHPDFPVDEATICNSYGSDSIYGDPVVIPDDFNDDYEVNPLINLGAFNK